MKSPVHKHSSATAIILETLKEAERSLVRLGGLIATLANAIAAEAEDHAHAASNQQSSQPKKSDSKSASLSCGPVLQHDALYSWKEIAPFVGIGRETWRRRVAEGKAPQPVYLSSRCTRYRGSEVLNWINTPSAYLAQAGNDCGANSAARPSVRRIKTGGKK